MLNSWLVFAITLLCNTECGCDLYTFPSILLSNATPGEPFLLPANAPFTGGKHRKILQQIHTHTHIHVTQITHAKTKVNALCRCWLYPSQCFAIDCYCDIMGWGLACNISQHTYQRNSNFLAYVKKHPSTFSHFLPTFSSWAETELNNMLQFKFVSHPLVEREQLQMGHPGDRKSSDAKQKLDDS